MIAIIQIILTFVLTVIYALTQVDFTSILSILGLVGFYLALNVGYIILIILLFIIVIYATSKVESKNLKKHQLLMVFSKYFFYSLLRVKVEVKGLENLPKDNNFVVYSNHIEYNDPFYLKQYYNHTPLSFVSKEPLFKYPILKTLLMSINCIPIGRLADRKSLEAILETIKTVKNGQPMGIFPEGKRSYSNNLGDFKPGAFKVAQKAKADISLAVLYNFHEINKNYFRIKKVKVYMTILPLIKYEEFKDLDTITLSKLAYEKINKELDNYKNTLN
jgi:1-acyl-sn-glycerol-3-phosphate acyltransferase